MISIKQLMQKEMTRKQFLVTVGFGLVAILGFDRILHLFGKTNPLVDNSSLYDARFGSYGHAKHK
jgi:hypothetical protein